MARPKSPPVFLGRTLYRRRRLRDAARLLPVVGVLLLLLPLLWVSDVEVRLGSGEVVYFFVVWLALIGLAAAFAPGLTRGDKADDQEED
ncbi:MAG: hypothetical protein MUE52_00260 [Tabrizicola sp.]|jgi:hypothetical protein|nr:hypothetical protein [Tabrizicola sp.]